MRYDKNFVDLLSMLCVGYGFERHGDKARFQLEAEGLKLPLTPRLRDRIERLCGPLAEYPMGAHTWKAALPIASREAVRTMVYEMRRKEQRRVQRALERSRRNTSTAATVAAPVHQSRRGEENVKPQVESRTRIEDCAFA
jgi:hypothetical protein